MTTTTAARTVTPMTVAYGGALAHGYWDDHGTVTVHLLRDPGNGPMTLTRISVQMLELLTGYCTPADAERFADALEHGARYLTPGPVADRITAQAAQIRRRLDVCNADSGSMTGCRPVCERPATRELTISNGLRLRMCDQHARHEPARAYPDTVTNDQPIGA